MRKAKRRRNGLLLRFVGLFVLCAVGVVGVSAAVHYGTAGHRFAMARDAETMAVEMGQSALVRTFRTAVADLYFLSELTALGRFLDTGGSAEADALARELIAFSRRRGIYERIQVVDATGSVLMRVEQNAGMPLAVTSSAPPEGLLQEDFRETLACPDGVVYMSTFDPPAGLAGAASVRFGVGLRGQAGERAVLLLTLRGAELLAEFERYRANGSADVMLLDGTGRPLGSGAAGRTLGLGPGDPRFQEAFAEEWQRIASGDSAQFETENGLFSFATVHPLGEVWDASCAFAEALPEDLRLDGGGDHPVWKVVSRLPPESLHAVARADLGPVTATGAAGLLVLGIGSWFLARTEERRRALQARMTESNRLLSSTLGRYLPDELRERLLGDPTRYERLGGEERSVTVLFADIRGFTRFAEAHDPQVVVETLNRVLSRLARAVLHHRGILDKFVGDGLMAFFEANPDEREAARRAVAAALDVRREFLAVHRELDGAAKELGLGIGIGSGTVVVGNVGSEEAMDFTAIGDPVNVAARLQSVAQPGEVLLDDATVRHLDGAVETERLPDLSLKGKRRPVAVHSVRIETPPNTEG